MEAESRREATTDLRPIVDALALGELQKRFLDDRWLDQVNWLERRARGNQRRYYWLRTLTIVGGVIVPALVSLNVRSKSVASSVAWTTFAISLIVALAAALEGFFRFGDRWRNYRRSAEALKSHGWQFIELAGPYASAATHEAAFPGFAAQVEVLIHQDVELYTTQIAQEPKHGASSAGAEGRRQPGDSLK
jgi:uncharacterized protein DUF4231